jgi:hypothetical protein
MVKRIIIVPDVHGRLFWNDITDRITESNLVIFLGDYVDPYPHENISKEEAIKNFRNIIEFRKKHDNCILLLGNHCLGYVFPEVCQCRRDLAHYAEIANLYYNNDDLFQIVYKYQHNDKTYIFSHAGIHNELLKHYNIDIDNINELFHDKDRNLREYLSEVSFYRGGYGSYGSCVWADIREFLAKEEVQNNTYQIVGHTMIERPYIGENMACLDCKKCFTLNLDTNTIEEL